VPREEFLQFIWKARLFHHRSLRTSCGNDLLILRQGEQNIHAGPDFFNARIRISGMVWAGNVEIHCRASDWERHGHHLNPAFNNVILHVVMEEDRPAFTSLGRRVPALVLRIPHTVMSKYQNLFNHDSWLYCQDFIHRVPVTQMQSWFTALMTERLLDKTERIGSLLQQNGQDWERSFYRSLGTGFGLPINTLPFELTLQSIPLEFLIRCRDNLEDLEALLFGQAGFLHQCRSAGPYGSDLQSRYLKFRSSLPSAPGTSHLWKFLRLRPASFPTLRIAQFASLVHHRFPLLDSILGAGSLTEIEQMLTIRAGEYWNTHYLFGRSSPEYPKRTGVNFTHNLILNSIVPFLFTYGFRTARKDPVKLAATILQELKAESNHIIRKWAKFGIVPRGAFESQALVQLFNTYCKQNRCLECRIGAGYLTTTTDEEQ
jgi:hypothetical protein